MSGTCPSTSFGLNLFKYDLALPACAFSPFKEIATKPGLSPHLLTNILLSSSNPVTSTSSVGGIEISPTFKKISPGFTLSAFKPAF